LTNYEKIFTTTDNPLNCVTFIVKDRMDELIIYHVGFDFVSNLKSVSISLGVDKGCIIVSCFGG